MYNSKKTVLAGFILSSASSLVLAAPFAVEGKLTQMNVNDPIAVGNQIVCNGVTINLTPTTVLSTPTGTITSTQLISPKLFPGKTALVPPDDMSPANSQGSAFIGGTCIVDGNDSGAANGRIATSVFVEMAENVLVGLSTNAPGSQFEIMGVPIFLLGPAPANSKYPDRYTPDSENRVVAVPVVNGTGMKVDIDTVLKGDESSAEGYMGVDGKGNKAFYSHAVVTTGGDPIEKQVYPIASVQRADMTYSNASTVKIDIRGGCTFVNTTTPQNMILLLDRGTNWVNALNGVVETADAIGTITTTCTFDPLTGQGTYRYRNDKFLATSPTATNPGNLPTKVRAYVVLPVTSTGAAGAKNYSENFMLNKIGFK